MKWFNKWFLKKSMWAWNNRHIIEEEDYNSPVAVTGAKAGLSTRSVESDPTLQFKVYSAIGGRVVEFYSYDPKTDRRNTQIYIISKDEDFGKKIAHIADLEILKL